MKDFDDNDALYGVNYTKGSTVAQDIFVRIISADESDEYDASAAYAVSILSNNCFAAAAKHYANTLTEVRAINDPKVASARLNSVFAEINYVQLALSPDQARSFQPLQEQLDAVIQCADAKGVTLKPAPCTF